MKNVGIVCCSNGQSMTYKKEIDELVDIFAGMGISCKFSDYIYENDTVEAGTPLERANALMNFYKDDTIDHIYDISGGDIANEILPYLDFDIIKASNKHFYGYSDLTTVINAIYAMTGNESVLYQVKNLVWDKTGVQKDTFLTDKMYGFNYDFIRGESMSGIMVGGNIRCLLKLAGTKYFPDMNDKILFLEAYSGMEPQLRAYFAHLSQMGVFSKVNGVLLGTFTELEKKWDRQVVVDIAREYIDETTPLAITGDIGHGVLSKALVIGQDYFL